MLSRRDLGFFARNGYLHLPGHVDDETCRRLVDHTWTRMPPEWRRDDPGTWTASVGDSCHIADLRTRRGLLQFQKGDLIDNPVITGAFGPEAKGGRFAAALIGWPTVTMRLRGLYSIIPLPADTTYPTAVRPHIESHAAQLIAMHYLEDVVPGGGGLSVWPGSHRAIYPVMGSKLEHVATPEFDRVFASWCRKQPIELSGRRGDLVIIHHRLLHAPSLNLSDRIRYAFLCDYQRSDFRSLSAQLPGPDLWEDWPAIAALPEDERDGPCDIDLPEQTQKVDARPMHARANPLSVYHSADTDASSIRKADASLLARSRQDGDIWLQVSDSEEIADDREVFPRGGRLPEGMIVTVDGVPMHSLCHFDFVMRLSLGEGPHSVEIAGAERPIWVKLLRVRLPFVRTEFLSQAQLPSGAGSLAFALGPRA